MAQASIPATVFRGGTSKGVFFEEADMPDDREAWDDLLLRTFGSPDPMQIDGIGGTHSVTSKAMLVRPGRGDALDVEYTFGQVSVDTPVVDWGGNCGNLTFAIGSFALERGLVSAEPGADRADLVLRNVNTDTVVEQSIPLDEHGRPEYRGDFVVAGVPGTGAPIRSRFVEPHGSETDELFPTGNRTDTLDVEGVGPVDVSLVDVASPCVFARAADLGMTAAEKAAEIDADPDLLDRLERVRSAACARYGFVDDPDDATAQSPGIPKMAVVGEKQGYETPDGERVEPDEFDLLARIMSMQKAHHVYAITGAMCTAVAAVLPGTVANEFLDGERPDRVTIGHPKGTLTVGVSLEGDGVRYTEVDRTARQVMVGELCYPAEDVRPVAGEAASTEPNVPPVE